ncbi:GntR family transcriptional regulator [Saccharothrix violaceirubra]|uniref:AcrR family transcriptional regulator n=1 Tax=Saccharothrix violaceirubra TaxID=413306 RepID=A0A7W7WVZ8_9PSEU|nr:GntR family transcriptional regulator [Saccharothrix violaceirubra]MBB4965855.1 AcrR family transcriptional regulator [Saccharothrix violaceirubra]
MSQDEAPYRRVAAEIRDRIATGALRPGDRVPSTRAITREWNVAMATATKVLTLLRQEGLVESSSAGTVVASTAGPRDRPRPAAEDLTRTRVVRAAVEIADAEGLAALSMRGIAARLGVAPMSIYRHVAGKDDLVLLMADAVLSELRLPAGPDAPQGWRPRLELAARMLWRVHRAHPWLAHLGPLTRPTLIPSLLDYSEWWFATLSGRGLDPALVLDLNVVLYSHIQGLAVQLEREAQAVDDTGVSGEQWMHEQESELAARLADGGHPAFASAMAWFGRTGYDLDFDALFERALTALLDHLAGLLGSGR